MWLRQPVPASRLCLGKSRHFVLRPNLVASGVKRTSITEPDFTRPSVMGPVMSSLPDDRHAAELTLLSVVGAEAATLCCQRER